MNSRADKNFFAQWWWTVDRVTLSAVIALLAVGLVLGVAASLAVTGKHAAGTFLFAERQIAFAFVAVGIMAGASLLSLRTIKVAGAVIFAVATILTVLVMFVGEDVLGAKRWIDLGFMTFQPSEFLKPSFAVLGAAILADRQEIRIAGRIVPKMFITFALIAPALFFLIKEPDVGQTAMMIALWGALLFFAGLPLAGVGILAGVSIALAWLAYLFLPHVHHRVEQYFDKDTGFQVGLALKAFAHGGLTGVGPGGGTVKYAIPQANSDFIFAVAGEEFGLILCAAIALLFAILTVRILLRSARARDPFAQLAGAALGIIIALQAFINMGVAVGILPAKGMTLPFISYGGSSLFAVALTTGLALAVTRQRSQIGVRDTGLFTMFGARA